MRAVTLCLIVVGFLVPSSGTSSPTMMSVIGQIGQRAAAGSDPCSGSPAIGTVCSGGALYLGTLSSVKYMITPGGCGYEPSGTSSTVPVSTFTPTCSGTDSVQKKWATGVEAPVASSATTGATSFTDGPGNTTSLAINYGDTAAAHYCHHLDLNGYTDWHLPSYDELNLFYSNRASIPGAFSGLYWSSSENTSIYAWAQDFPNSGSHDPNKLKTALARVRCVRRI